MSYRAQLSLMRSIGKSSQSPSFSEAWHSSLREDTLFFLARLLCEWDYDCQLLWPREQLNWNAVLGICVATIVSVGMWASIALMFARVFK